MYDARARNQEETIEARVSAVTFRSADSSFAILSMDRLDRREAITAVGPLREYQKGDRLKLVGRFETHSRYGTQLRVSFAHPIPPQDQESIREYLINAKVRGFGEKRVDQLLEKFGADTLNVIVNHPERLKELGGLGDKRIDRLREVVREQTGRQETMLFLYELQLSAAVAARVWAQYLERSREVIEANPFELISTIELFDFQLAERIARKIGWDLSRIERISAALKHILNAAQEDGHVCLPRVELLNRTARFLNSPDRCEEALERSISEGELTLFEELVHPTQPSSASDSGSDSGSDSNSSSNSSEPEVHPYIYLAELADLEREAAREVKRIATRDVEALYYEPEDLTDERELTLAEAQLEAIEVASRQPLLLLTGGPGTGKTTTVSALIALFELHELTVQLAAPTGRAARRLSETTGCDAQTIHRLLDYQPQEEIFRRDVDEPLEADVVLIDETSMVDLRLFVSLLRALPKNCRLILVGDANQLPSVGAGRVYRDLLTAETIPTVTLEVVFRQAHASHIVANAYQVLNGQPLIAPPQLAEGELPDFFNIKARSNEHAAELIEQLVTERIPNRFDIESRDIQVITPMYRGHCGANELNKRLQRELNGSGRSVHKTSPLRVGDRVMQLKNYYDKDVYNGDTGIIIARHEEGAVVDFDGRVVNYTKEHLSMLSLAYACSIHKSQGSEYPAVVIPVIEEHWSMQQRDLLYTAITRGQRLVILVSSDAALERAIRHQVSHWRCTHLHTRLTQP